MPATALSPYTIEATGLRTLCNLPEEGQDDEPTAPAFREFGVFLRFLNTAELVAAGEHKKPLN